MAWQTVSLPFGAGVDSKTDSKMLAPPKLIVCQDAIFTNLKRLTKRNGYIALTLNISGGGTITNPTMVQSYNDEILVAGLNSNGGTQRLFSYSGNEEVWIDKGPYVSIAVGREEIASNPSQVSLNTLLNPAFGFFNVNSVSISPLNLYTAETSYPYSSGKTQAQTFGQSNVGSIYFSIQDTTTGTYLSYQTAIASASGAAAVVFSKPVVLGTTQFAVFYVNTLDYSSPFVAFRLISISGSGVVTVGSEISVAACASSSGVNVQYPYCYDLVSIPSGAFLAISNGSNLNCYHITTAGTVSSITTIGSAANILPINCSTDAAGNIWVYWATQVTGTSTWFVAIFTPTFSSLLGATQIKAGLGGAMATQIAAISINSTTQQVWLAWQTTGGLGLLNEAIYPTYIVITVNTAGSNMVLFTPLQCIDIYGRPFFVNGNLFIPVYSYSQSQSTGYILDALNNLPVAKFEYQACDGIYESGTFFNDGATQTGPVMLAGRYPGFLSNPLQLTSTLIGLATGQATQETFFIQPTVSVANASAFATSQTTNVFPSLNLSSFDFNNIESNQAFVSQQTVVMNGGVVQIYDGGKTSELGWNYEADNISALPITSGGSIGEGIYAYSYTNVWVDANGNQYESSPSPPVTVIFTTGSSNSVELVMPHPESLTNKIAPGVDISQVVQKVWRTDSNTGTELAYLVAGTAGSTTGPPQCRHVTDTLSTASLTTPGNPTLYTQGGTILENISPPPSNILWTNNNRTWCVDSENQSTTIDYSKTAAMGLGILFSFGQLEYIFDSKSGPVSGASPMDEKTIILKSNGIAYFIGDGDNDSGTGSTLTPLQFIPSDTGGSNSKAVISYPNGLLFRASNNKGIYLITRGLQVGYFGLDVNAFNAQDVQSIQFDGNRNQIRFLTSNGMSLLYDYVMQQWSTFTNHTGVSATIFLGVYVYIRVSGEIYVEDPNGGYLDAGVSYAPLIQTAFIKATVIQNFERIRRIELLGDCLGINAGHGVQIQVAYDFQPATLPPVRYTFVKTPYQYRQRMSRQKADSLQFIIQEVVTGASGEYIDFSDLGLEIQGKVGLNKLPGASSVG